MAARDAKARRLNASIAANARWAREPNRTEATTAARRRSPQSFEYWREWAREQHPEMTPAGQLKAAKSAYREHMQRLAKKRKAAGETAA